ncbi:MAG: SDR family NAD(P)-dependent oxidoreductase, partial [Mycobacterium sp.]|nr:SDR family NAD(P)-dependent oxidoreductase [Mycobacterium sp.]
MPTAMITGASGGLGSALADALAPTHTLLLAGRPSPRLDAVAERLGATTWPMDLADPDSLAAVVEPIVELDVLIHNAGVAYPGRVAETSVDEWRSSMAVNVIGAVALTLELLPALRAAEGHVVFINSGSGINPSPGLAS